MRNNVSEPLNRACVGRVLPERNMRSYLVIIDGIFRKDSAKVIRVERDQPRCFVADYEGTHASRDRQGLVRWRMGIAAQLLEHTGLRLTEIAARLGYKSEFSFSRAFRRARGLSPMQFRNQAKPADIQTAD